MLSFVAKFGAALDRSQLFRGLGQLWTSSFRKSTFRGDDGDSGLAKTRAAFCCC